MKTFTPVFMKTDTELETGGVQRVKLVSVLPKTPQHSPEHEQKRGGWPALYPWMDTICKAEASTESTTEVPGSGAW